MKIKKGFVISKIGDDTVAVATGELSKKFSGVVFLNGSGEFLWDKLAEDTDTDKLLAAMLDKYDVDEQTARADIAAFVEKLTAAGIIE